VGCCHVICSCQESEAGKSRHGRAHVLWRSTAPAGPPAPALHLIHEWTALRQQPSPAGDVNAWTGQGEVASMEREGRIEWAAAPAGYAAPDAGDELVLSGASRARVCVCQLTLERNTPTPFLTVERRRRRRLSFRCREVGSGGDPARRRRRQADRAGGARAVCECARDGGGCAAGRHARVGWVGGAGMGCAVQSVVRRHISVCVGAPFVIIITSIITTTTTIL
jgi:hypothetical protein